MSKYTQRTRCLIQGCLYGLPFKKPKKNCMFCGEPRQELGVYSDATKPESDKEKCLHDHLCCPGDIKTVRCAYCGKSMYHEPQEELEGFTMDELDRAVEKSIKDGTNPYLKEEELEVEDIRGIILDEKHCDQNINKLGLKISELIKAHNALVSEVKNK